MKNSLTLIASSFTIITGIITLYHFYAQEMVSWTINDYLILVIVTSSIIATYLTFGLQRTLKSGLTTIGSHKAKIFLISSLFITSISIGGFVTYQEVTFKNIAQEPSCLFDNQGFGLLMSALEENDNTFSSYTYEILKSEIESDTIIQLRRLDRSLSSFTDDKLKKELDSLCLNYGLVITGKFDFKREIFFGHVKFHNTDISSSSGISHMNQTFLVQNPDVDNFSVQKQSNILANFALGYSFYGLKDYDKAAIYFRRVIQANKSEENRKLIANCHVLLGNSKFDDNQEEAFEEYKKARSIDKTVKAATFNQAIILTERGDFKEAKKILSQYPDDDERVTALRNILDKGIQAEDKVKKGPHDIIVTRQN